MFSIGLPRSGNVMRKNLAVFGSDDRALAKPFNCDAIRVMVTFQIWFRDNPAEAYPIEQRVMSRPMNNSGLADRFRTQRLAINEDFQGHLTDHANRDGACAAPSPVIAASKST